MESGITARGSGTGSISLLYLVGFVGGEAVAFEEIGGLGHHFIEEDSGVTLGME